MGFIKSLVTGQPNTFSAKQAPLDEASYADAIKKAQANALAVNPQQQDLADALRAAAAGGGPSVAEQQLRRTTGENVQRTAGLVASQRGMNPALAARIAAMAGANANQEAAGQGATLHAQEQVAARAQLGDVLSGMQSGATSLAGTTGSLQNNQNATRVQNVLGTNQVNAGVARDNAQFEGAVLGGLAGGAGAAMGKAAMKAEGGEIPGRPETSGDSYRNDTVPILASPGEIVVPRSIAQAPDAPDRTADFVRALKEKKSGSADSGAGYGKALAHMRAIDERLSRIERMAEGGEVAGSLVDRVKAWWSSGDSDRANTGRAVADDLDSKLPDSLSARQAIERKRAQLRALDAATAEN